MTTHFVSHQPALAGVRELLSELAEARQRQLDELPTATEDLVAAAHRASVHRILEDVRAALRRCEDGTYGECTRCGADIGAERLELLPWASACVRCSRR